MISRYTTEEEIVPSNEARRYTSEGEFVPSDEALNLIENEIFFGQTNSESVIRDAPDPLRPGNVNVIVNVNVNFGKIIAVNANVLQL